jgi:hypothetical protein
MFTGQMRPTKMVKNCEHLDIYLREITSLRNGLKE